MKFTDPVSTENFLAQMECQGWLLANGERRVNNMPIEQRHLDRSGL